MFTSTNQTIFNPTKKLNINASTPSSSQVATCKLFVGNLATHTTGAHLQAIFHSYGQVIECVKVRERYGFVRFATAEEAQRALVACNGIQLNGYPMIVEYAQNEILISPLSPRTTNNTSSSAPFRPHPYHAGRSTMSYQTDTKLTTPIAINTNSRHSTNNNSNRDDIPLLSASTTDTNYKYVSSTLNPDASSFTISFSPSNQSQQTCINNKISNIENICSTSDYHSQSGALSSSSSSSIRSTGSLSPSILSAISPSILLSLNSSDDEQTRNHRININEKRQPTNTSLNLFIGDKILSLYGSTTHVDTNNNQSTMMNLNIQEQNSISSPFDSREIDPRDPIFIWNFVFYPDVSISPFVKRDDIKTLLERRVSLYSR
ncbi:unnamed protein product [Rotaria sp. Silwood1]|nr:unnamed protein product [Rotaria sp. Silwood1]CAF1142690.1 unnamed protein product [Rotaria sp. Silwood1]CAF3428889.1 unnamed protein product [Rotaria sp. Silwood1]CAF3474764.1 unnamed protein product [Rotaria sp. Silwood1]CAF3486122.1 unnamed protein product [Rotaria sp. Silwood1]